MAKENPQIVARKISESIRAGKRINKGQILRDAGYSKSTSEKPALVTETKAYKEAVKPFLEKLEAERDRIIAAIATKNLDDEKHNDLVRSLDTVTKNVQLLSGKETERTGVTIELVSYEDTPTT